MMARDRDRDAAGRARNARPRDAFGRPLARGEAGETPVPDDLSLPAAEALALAQRLLDSGRPFQAHEVLEATWKSAPTAERDLWQGLAQVAVGLTHARRGNARGAVALLSRGAQRVRAYQAAAPSLAGPYGMDLTAFLAASDDLAARIERDGLADIPDAALRPGLRAL
jgi:hypothetical protein